MKYKFSDVNKKKGESAQNFNRDLNILKGCNIEIIMKDISTVKYGPQKIMAMG